MKSIPKPGSSIIIEGKCIVVNYYEKDIKATIQLDDGQIIEVSLDICNLSSPKTPTPTST